MQVQLQGCEFTNNTAEHVLVASHGDGYNEAQFYSDITMDVFMPDGMVPHTTHTLNLADAPEQAFLSASDAWITDLRKVCTFFNDAAMKKHCICKLLPWFKCI